MSGLVLVKNCLNVFKIAWREIYFFLIFENWNFGKLENCMVLSIAILWLVYIHLYTVNVYG